MDTWRSFLAQRGHFREIKVSTKAMIVFVVGGSVTVSIGHLEKKTVRGGNFFLLPPGQSVELHVEKSAKLITCSFVRKDILFWEENISSGNPVDKEGITVIGYDGLMIQFLSFMTLCLRNKWKNVVSGRFFELKKRELFFLIFFLYGGKQLAEFFFPVMERKMNPEKTYM